jgi:hypothetical protein
VIVHAGGFFYGRGASVPRSDRSCRSDARRFKPLDFSFAPAWLDLLLLAFRAYLFGRGWIRSGESGSPPLFAPFLKVEGDIGHFKLASLLAISRVGTARECRLAAECTCFKFWHLRTLLAANKTCPRDLGASPVVPAPSKEALSVVGRLQRWMSGSIRLWIS